jgi:anaerobic selenocysteine-containing dehydrogenase
MDSDDITRRDFVKTTAAAGCAVTAGVSLGAQQVVETNVEIRTPDGTCDGGSCTRPRVHTQQ